MDYDQTGFINFNNFPEINLQNTVFKLSNLKVNRKMFLINNYLLMVK
jgi:hypothetical protein